MVINSIIYLLSKMKNKVLPTSLQENYRQFRRVQQYMSYGVFGAEVVKIV